MRSPSAPDQPPYCASFNIGHGPRETAKSERKQIYICERAKKNGETTAARPYIVFVSFGRSSRCSACAMAHQTRSSEADVINAALLEASLSPARPINSN